MERRLIESYLADPTGNARLARIEQLQQTLRMVLEDRVTTSTPQGRLRQQEILATLRRQINALGGTFTPAPAPAPAAAPATPAATPAPAAAPVAPAAPAAPVAAPAPVLNPNAMVSVNPAGTIFYSQGTRYFGHTAAGWRQMTVAQAQALGARPAAFAAAAVIPTGVYAVEHPVLGEPRIVIRSLLGYRQARARLEQHMASAGQYAITEIQGWQRAHSQGPGLGVESGEAIRLAPEFVNQALQNRGVEQFLRDLRDWTLRDGDAVHMTTVTETHTGTLRLEAIEYRIEIRRAGSTIQVGDVRIEVMRDGTSRGAVRSPGSETYTYTPAYDVSGNPVR
jgi:hypothetical protein